MEKTVNLDYLDAAPSVTSHGPQRRGGDDHRLFGWRHQVDSAPSRLALFQVASGNVNAVASLEDLFHGDDAVNDVTHVQAHQLLFQLLLPSAPFEKYIYNVKVSFTRIRDILVRVTDTYLRDTVKIRIRHRTLN